MDSRPPPGDLLAGVMHSLQSKVLPALDDPVTREQVSSVVGILGYLRQHWDTAVRDLAEEVDGIERLLADAAAPLRDAGHGEAGERLARLAAERTDDLAYSALAARSEALQEGLVELLMLVERAAEGGAGDGPLAALRPRVLDELVALNRRRLAPRDGPPGTT
jgi:hypothetical protein